MLRTLAVALLCAFAAAAGAEEAGQPPAETGYSAAPWIADLAQAERVLADQAPNLEWSIKERGLDLPELARQAEDGLYAARSDGEAREVLRNFLNQLGDGHISLDWPDERQVEEQVWGTASICKSLGYRDEERAPGLPFDKAGGRAIATPDSEIFPIHVLDLPGGRLGVLRIPSFHEWGYYRYCPQAVAIVGLPDDGECAEDCGGQIGRKSAELLTEAVARQIEVLKGQGISALAVDITQNGGGSLWLDPVARMLTGVKLKAPQLALTRTPAWRAALQTNLNAVEADLANPILGLGYRTVLTEAQAKLKQALAEANISCDRMALWQGKTPGCSLIPPTRLFATGVLDYAEPGAFTLLRSASALFYSALYSYDEGLWQGPLYVMLDEGSASAAEHFATLLKDNGAATLIGEPTFGAGCGWMASGDMPVTLARTGGQLHVPDCVWYRKDGTNEVAGVEPDILIPWRYYDNGVQKARRAVTALSQLKFGAPTAPAGAPTADVGGGKTTPAQPAPAAPPKGG
ncbi:MAG: hypothetical protein IT548_08030 [Alphaproteobacteria bacterium]|nr:hypothetical protein [Alphaproteobacteria bacterium]